MKRHRSTSRSANANNKPRSRRSESRSRNNSRSNKYETSGFVGRVKGNQDGSSEMKSPSAHQTDISSMVTSIINIATEPIQATNEMESSGNINGDITISEQVDSLIHKASQQMIDSNNSVNVNKFALQTVDITLSRRLSGEELFQNAVHLIKLQYATTDNFALEAEEPTIEIEEITTVEVINEEILIESSTAPSIPGAEEGNDFEDLYGDIGDVVIDVVPTNDEIENLEDQNEELLEEDVMESNTDPSSLLAKDITEVKMIRQPIPLLFQVTIFIIFFSYNTLI